MLECSGYRKRERMRIRIAETTFSLHRREMEHVVHIERHSESFQFYLLEPITIFKIVVCRDARKVKHVITLYESCG